MGLLSFVAWTSRHNCLAVGVILAGMLKDGTSGLCSIKEAGGLAFLEGPCAILGVVGGRCHGSSDFAISLCPCRPALPVTIQLATWPAASDTGGGNVAAHWATTSRQRGAKLQPDGRALRSGGLPGMASIGRLRGWPCTVEESMPSVYGCLGLISTSRTPPYSMIRPA